MHPHGSHTYVAQGLQIASALQHSTDRCRKQAQVFLVIVGKPIAVAGTTRDLVDDFKGTVDLVAQSQGDTEKRAIGPRREMRANLCDAWIVPTRQDSGLAQLKGGFGTDDVTRQTLTHFVC